MLYVLFCNCFINNISFYDKVWMNKKQIFYYNMYILNKLKFFVLEMDL